MKSCNILFLMNDHENYCDTNTQKKLQNKHSIFFIKDLLNLCGGQKFRITHLFMKIFMFYDQRTADEV